MTDSTVKTHYIVFLQAGHPLSADGFIQLNALGKKKAFEKNQPRITQYFRTDNRKEHTHQPIPHKGRPPDVKTTTGLNAPSQSTTVQRLMTFFSTRTCIKSKQFNFPTKSPAF
jgi:hypothetical protein